MIFVSGEKILLIIYILDVNPPVNPSYICVIYIDFTKLYHIPSIYVSGCTYPLHT